MPKQKKMEITCPYCKKNIILDTVLTNSIEEKIRREFESELEKTEEKYTSELDRKNKQLNDLKKSFAEKIEDALESKREEIEKEAKKKAVKSMGLELKDLQEQINEKNELLEKSQNEELKLRKEQRKLEEDKRNFELEIERKLDESKTKLYEDAVKNVSEEHELKDREKQKQIDDLRKQITEWKMKAEQGSQKLQGEVLELELEYVLKENFIYDQIEPISSGISGADILQKVCSNSGKICGTILIESKNAKKWNNNWISKLKKDQREAKADMGVIVSTALPESISNFDCVEGIIIIHYKSIIPVTTLLRNQLFEIARTKSFNVGRNEKMELLYNYITGREFRQTVESTGEAFAQMMNDLQKEKRAMTKIWSKREKQIEQAFYGIAKMYGGMQGVIGSSLPEIKSLNMPELLCDDLDKDD
ncbi:MAG: DUF2130 domain-containing protein [archaeon]